MHLKTKIILILVAIMATMESSAQYVQPMGYKDYSFWDQVNIGNRGAKTTNPAAYLEIGKRSGSTRGVLPPSGNRDSVIIKYRGLIFDDSVNNKLVRWNGSAWEDLGAGSSDGNSYVTSLSYVSNVLTVNRNGLSAVTVTLPFSSKLNVTDTAGKWITQIYKRSDTLYYVKGGAEVFAAKITVDWLGTSSQYIKGDGTLGTFTTDVQTIGDARYALISHAHSPSDITNLTTYVRNLFSAGSGLVYNSTTGVFSYPGAGSGITELNGLTDGVQTLATGTSGTDFNISSVGSGHAFNIPTVSGSARGLVTSALYTTWNAKQDAITITTTGTSGPATLVGSTLNIPQYSGTSYTDEQAQDAIGAMVSSEFTYTDATPLLAINSINWSKITSTPTTLSGYGITDIPISADAATNKYLNWNGSAYVRKQVDYSELSGTPPTGSVSNALTIGAELSSIGATTYNGSSARTIGIQSASVTNAMLANSTISGIALGSNLADLTATNTTLTLSGTYNGSTARTIGLNLGSSNIWTASTKFVGNAQFGTTGQSLLGTILFGGLNSSSFTFSGVSTSTSILRWFASTDVSFSIGANSNYIPTVISGAITGTITTASSGTHPIVSQLALQPLVINANATTPASITTAATLYIDGAATGTATKTNNYSLFVYSGMSRLDGGLTLGSLSTDNTATQVLAKASTGESVWRDVSSLGGSLPSLAQYHFYVGNGSSAPVDAGNTLAYNGTTMTLLGTGSSGNVLNLQQVVGGGSGTDVILGFIHGNPSLKMEMWLDNGGANLNVGPSAAGVPTWKLFRGTGNMVVNGTNDIGYKMAVYGAGTANSNTGGLLVEYSAFLATSVGGVKIGNTTTPTALLDLIGSTTSMASLRIEAGTPPTSPNDGEIWNDNSTHHLMVRLNGTSIQLDQPTGHYTPLASFYTDVSNSSSTETDLYSHTLGANKLVTNGDKIIAEFFGTFNSPTSAVLKFYFAGAVESFTGISANQRWKIRAVVVKTGTTTGRLFVELLGDFDNVVDQIADDVTGVSWTSTNLMKITGQDGSSTKITAKLGSVDVVNY
jgi:hypothetical protein